MGLGYTHIKVCFHVSHQSKQFQLQVMLLSFNSFVGGKKKRQEGRNWSYTKNVLKRKSEKKPGHWERQAEYACPSVLREASLEGDCVCMWQVFQYLLCPALSLLPRLPRNAQTCPFRHRGKNRNKKKGGIIRTQAPNSFKNGFYLYKSLHIPNTVISWKLQYFVNIRFTV